MAEIHKKKPLIKKRMGAFHKKGSREMPKKKNVHIETLKRGLGVIGSGLAKVGRELSKPETHQKLGAWGRNVGEFTRKQSFGFGYEQPRKQRKR